MLFARFSRRVPTVTISSAGRTTASAKQTIRGTVDVADAGSTVKIFDGTTLIGSAVVAANGAWSASVTLTNLGVNVLKATDTNRAGTGTSNAVAYTLVTAAPTVTISSAGRATASAKQMISGTVDVADAGSTVKIFDGTTQIGSAVVAANGVWSASVTLTNLGVNVLKATDTNRAGTGTSNAVAYTLLASVPSGYSAADLVFDEFFSGASLNVGSWNTYLTSNAAQGWAWLSNGSGGSSLGGAYAADYSVPSQVSVSNGLTLNAVKQSIAAPGNITGATATQTYPETSGVVSSYGKMEFNGGYLQIEMKQPSGDGSWPGLWLLPGKGAGTVGDNYEIDIQEGGYKLGSANPNDVVSYHIHTPKGTFGGEVDTGVDLSAGVNTFAIDWIPGQSVTWYLNGAEIAEITSATAPIPNEFMELIMSNDVANSAASDWHTTLDSSTPASMAMHVSGVQLFQHAGSGAMIMGGNV